MKPKHTIVAVVIYNRFSNLQRWVECWHQCITDNAELIIVHNYYGDQGEKEKYSRYCMQHGIKYVPRLGEGYDIGAFQDVCRNRLTDFPNYDYILWCTDDCIPMQKDFIAPFIAKLTIPGVGVSCMQISSEYANHVRTTGFCLRKETAQALTFPADPIQTKDHCFAFEHRAGAGTLYGQILSMGLVPMAVAPDAESPLWDTEFWRRLPRQAEHDRMFRHPSLKWEIINHIAEKIGAKRYLEIGVDKGSCMRQIHIPEKWGVDPAPQVEGIKAATIFVSKTSDDFFETITPQTGLFDIVFIDGLHHAEQVYRDVQNSLKILSPNGVIILHNCNPSTEEMQIVPMIQDEWTGDVWKTIVRLRQDNLWRDHISVVNSDYGVGLIVPPHPTGGARPPQHQTPPQLTWSDLDADRKALLGLREPSEWVTWFEAQRSPSSMNGNIYHDVPIFIICRDRLAPLQQLIEWLERTGHTNIVLVDNASTYPPLLEFLESCPHHLVSLPENVGHLAVWAKGLQAQFASKTLPGFYVVSDCDVVPDEDCPGDVIERLHSILRERPNMDKAGLGLKIDDLPDCFQFKREVIDWESQFWETLLEPGVYDAPIDTTFALYRPGPTHHSIFRSIRTGSPYTAKHLPWYQNSTDLTPEEIYYQQHMNKDIGSWGHETLPSQLAHAIEERRREIEAK